MKVKPKINSYQVQTLQLR